jgi:hypothetical protein
MFEIVKTASGFYRIGEQRSEVLASMLGMKHTKYKHVMIHQFGGHDGNPDRIYFDKIENAENALEWIHSILLMRKLVE